MRRVYGIYYMRQLLRPEVRLTAFLSILLVITSSVSMPNIIRNAEHSSNFLRYLLSSLTTTTLYVQLGVLIAGLILISALVDTLRPRPGRAGSRASFYA